jgi:16S rRNA (guanine527-N7)-methyltransferase
VFPEFEVSPEQSAALESHRQLLLKWNDVINLTREDSWERHYGESIFLARHLPPGELKIADVGSGAGFPGLPVAIVRPDCKVTLIESHQRKSVFLREASRQLPNVRVLATRMEVVIESFDWVISRGVSYRDLGRHLKRLAPNAMLLAGAETPPDSLGFVWDVPIPLPGSVQRFLRVGHSAGVSRETV